MTNYRKGPQQTTTNHNGPQRRQIRAQRAARNCKRRSELQESQGRQTEARETVMKCKGNEVSCQKLH